MSELREILRSYRRYCDAAWSEVTDKVHTAEEYQGAEEKITDQAERQIIEWVEKEVKQYLQKHPDATADELAWYFKALRKILESSDD